MKECVAQPGVRYFSGLSIHLGSQGLSKEDEHLTNSPTLLMGYGTLYLYL